MPDNKKFSAPDVVTGGKLVDKVVSGTVKSVAITKSDGLVFELKGAANRNKSYTVDTDDPHYSGSVSLVMMAYSTQDVVVVNHSGLAKVKGPVLVAGGASAQQMYAAKAVGIGADPEVD